VLEVDKHSFCRVVGGIPCGKTDMLGLEIVFYCVDRPVTVCCVMRSDLWRELLGNFIKNFLFWYVVGL